MSEQNDGKKLSARVMSKLVSSVKRAVSKREGVILCLPFVAGDELESLKQQIQDEGIKISNENGQTILTIEGMEGQTELNKEISVSESSHIPKNGGSWSGKEGDSKWIPNSDDVPKKPKNQTKSWAEINNDVTESVRDHIRRHVVDGNPTESEIANYVFDGIVFEKGNPDFSPISFGTVKLENMYTSDRRVNYALADDAYGRETGRDPIEVAAWMKKNKMTWHESDDKQTMMKVPSIVHGNVCHNGGVNAIKKEGAGVNVVNKSQSENVGGSMSRC